MSGHTSLEANSISESTAMPMRTPMPMPMPSLSGGANANAITALDSNDSTSQAPDSFLQGFGGKKLFKEAKLKRGVPVEIKDLKAKPELNGLVGVVLSYDKKMDRYGVEVDFGSEINELVFKLQAKQEEGSSSPQAGTATVTSNFSLKKVNLDPISDLFSWLRTLEGKIELLSQEQDSYAGGLELDAMSDGMWQGVQYRNAQQQQLRFDLNDRVVCNIGMRWIGGGIVGRDPEKKEGWCYLVKTDPHSGLESRTISVPSDSEKVCVQEVCFGLDQMHHTKGAAPELPDHTANKSFRFELGQRVTCLVRHQADLLENWQAGVVDAVNPMLPGPGEWGEGDIDGELATSIVFRGFFPASVPYRVQLDRGDFVFCHADNHTLIRREGLEPQTRVKGISNRMEDRKDASGLMVRFDHVTERQKCLDNSDSLANIGVDELTEAQKKALFIC
eukprot:gnl/TRDRNA2_/TRDRNA2_77780_c0_seq1.p1 gnl/TRDRNA2_/TRDRNA2_77780_c0~~gnl/TRDRNA2_/TRDRNA2_77780_c0_seq1.p1  ORF type:complete len:446 (+),score=76.50 gnl/TRDRNA2_/TRDRNA2_77780_c0_seq1:51-1388(+)